MVMKSSSVHRGHTFTFPSSLSIILAALTFYHAKSACDHQKSLNNCSPGQYLPFDKCDLVEPGYYS